VTVIPLPRRHLPVEDGEAGRESAEPATPAELRRQILRLTHRYSEATAGKKPFVAGRTRVDYAGRVYDSDEVTNLVSAALDFWLTEGPYAHGLEQALCRFLGVGHTALVNSGSSANLVALSALTARELGERRLGPGDEVITVAGGFPTTVAPIVQVGAVPVFVDLHVATANIDPEKLEDAVSSRTRAVMLAHTLGNPFDIDEVLACCRRHGLWLVEDNCDALGSRYTSTGHGRPVTRLTGGFGDIATSSFYPAHHMTTGEGGAVYTSDDLLDTIIRSVRDWGRGCWCKPGRDNTCGERFSGCHGDLPFGYDHKYVYARFGYNLKMTDLQAAVGVAQVSKLEAFGQARRDNFRYLYRHLAPYADMLRLPEATRGADPSWFGFLIGVLPEAPFTRADLVAELEQAKIQTRALFAGNLLRHPCFDEMRSTGSGYRVTGDLDATDTIMRSSFWVGVYPGMTADRLDHMVETVTGFLDRHRS